MFPQKNIRSFLDVDDLNNIHILEQNVKDSKNFLLLITEGALQRPFVQVKISYNFPTIFPIFSYIF